MNKSALSTIIGVSLLSLVKKGSAGKTKLFDLSDTITISITTTYRRPHLNNYYDTYSFYGIGEHLENVIGSFDKEMYQDYFVDICTEREEDIKEAIAEGLEIEEGSPEEQLLIAIYEAGKARVRDNRRIVPLSDWIKFYKDTIPKESGILQEIEEQAQEKMFSDLNDVMNVNEWSQEAQERLGDDFDFEDELPYPTKVTWDNSPALEDEQEELEGEWHFDNLLNTPLTIHFTFSMADLKERYSDKQLVEIIGWKNNFSSSRYQIEKVISAILNMAHIANVNQPGDWGRGLKFDDEGGFEEFTYSSSIIEETSRKSKLRRR